MLTLIMGSSASGKSGLAENLAEEAVQKLSAIPGNHEKIYLATMEKEAGPEIVARHKAMREGKGFRALEIPRDIKQSMLESGDYDALWSSVILLEDLPNLVANELYGQDAEETKEDFPRKAAEKILRDLLWLSQESADLIIVSQDMGSAPVPSGMEEYMKAMEYLHVYLAREAVKVYEVVAGMERKVKNVEKE